MKNTLMVTILFALTVVCGCGGGGGSTPPTVNPTVPVSDSQPETPPVVTPEPTPEQAAQAAQTETYDRDVAKVIEESGVEESFSGNEGNDLVQKVSAMPGVASVETSEYALSVTYEDGGRHVWIIGDPLSSTEEDYESSQRVALERQISARTLQRRTGNTKAVIINSIADDPGFSGPKKALADIKGFLEQAGYEVYEKNGQEASIEFFKNGLSEYGVVMILAHGGAGDNAHYFYMQTGQPYNSGDEQKYWDDYKSFKIAKVTIDWGVLRLSSRTYWAVGSTFIKQYYANSGKSFPGSIVYNSACEGMKYDVMAKAFVDSGAGVYLGWTEEQGKGPYTASIIFADMLDGDNVGVAYNNLGNDYRTDNRWANAELKYYPESGSDYQIVNTSVEAWVSPPSVTLANGKADAVLSCTTSAASATLEATCKSGDSWTRLDSQKHMTCTYTTAGTFYPICRIKNNSGNVLAQSGSSVTVVREASTSIKLYMSTTSANGPWSTTSVTGKAGDSFYSKITGAAPGESIFRHFVGKKDGIDYGGRTNADSNGNVFSEWKSTCTAVVQQYDAWVEGSDGRASNHVLETVDLNSSCSSPVLQMSTASANGPWSTTSVSGYQGNSFYTKVTGLQPNGVATRHIVGKRDGVDYGDTFNTGPSGVFTQTWNSTCASIVQEYDIWIVDSTGKQSNHVTETLSSSNTCSAVGTTFQYPVSPYGPFALGFFSDGVHLGEDTMLNEGTPIRAIADGRIIYYGPANGYGELLVGIEHSFGGWKKFNLSVGQTKFIETNMIVSIYGHLRKSQVRGGQALAWKYGDYVKKNDIIGYVNDDAHNGDGGPHLHFGCRLTGETPGEWILWGRQTAGQPQSDVRFYAAYSEIINLLPR